MNWFTKFLHDLVTPTVTERSEERKGLSLKHDLIASIVLAEVISGEDTTFVDKAVFVGMPYAVRAAATFGAQKGLGESEN